MKYSVSDYLTLKDIKTEDYKLACDFAKNLTEKNFKDNVCIRGDLLKIVSVEIVRNHDQVVPWIDAFTFDHNTVRLISFNAYNPDDNFTRTFVESK